MQLIMHRCNTIAALQETDPRYGVEVDIRSVGEQLIIHHDPFMPGESFAKWLDAYCHALLILNVKEEGLESRLIGLLNAYGIKNYFFLDQSFPFLVKWSKMGERRCAVRVSEFESVETALCFTGQLDWVWVDCFSHFPLCVESANRLKVAGFKLCLVSPELQGRDPIVEIPSLATILIEQEITVSAICTKRPDLWEKTLCCV